MITWPQVYHVKERQHPPPRTARRSCVYVYRRRTGHHYVGETDDLKGRLLYHQRKARGRLGPFETWYICIPRTEGAKSMGRAIEKSMIESMVHQGYVMESTRDVRNKHFGLSD